MGRARSRHVATHGQSAVRRITDVRIHRTRLTKDLRNTGGIVRTLILGGDGYLGWPTAMRLAAHGDDVMVVDNYLRRTLAQNTGCQPLMPTPDLLERTSVFRAVSGHDITVEIGDCTDQTFVDRVVRQFQPD